MSANGADVERVVLEHRLDGTNFRSWKFHVMAILRGKGLLSVVDGSSPKPAATEDDKSREEWSQKDGKAMAILFSTISKSQTEHVLSCQTAAEMMAKIDSVHQVKSDVRVMMLYEEYFSAKMQEDESVASYFSRLSTLACDIESQGEKLSDNIKMCRIIHGLTPKFRNFRTVWFNIKECRTLNTMMEKLQLEEDNDNKTQCDENHDVAFSAKHKENKKKKGLSLSEKQKKSTCHACGEIGHWQRDCRKKRDGDNSTNSGKKQKANMVAFTVIADSLCTQSDSDVWIADSGATKHITHRRDWFSEYHSVNDGRYVEIANNEKMNIAGYGTIEIQACIDGVWYDRRLENVQYVPTIQKNLFGTNGLTAKGFEVNFRKDVCELINEETEEVAAVGYKDKDQLFRMAFRVCKREQGNVCTTNNVSLQQWHRRLGHINVTTIKSMCKNGLVSGVDFTNEENFFCEDCQLGKMHRSSHPLAEKRFLEKGECIHVDLCGPMETTGIGGVRYFMLLKDEATGFRFVYLIRQKSEVEKLINEFVVGVEKRMEVQIKRIRCDNGTEFINKNVTTMLAGRGITFERIAPYTPQQNGFIERDNRTVQESARTMLIASDLGKSLWPEAVRTAVYLLNRSPGSRDPKTTPFEQWFCEKPALDHVKVFGTVGYAFVPKQRKKWDPKATKVHLVGYEPTQKNFRLYEPNTKKIIISCDVKFNENFIRSEYVSLSSENDSNVIDQPGDQSETVKHNDDDENTSLDEEDTLINETESTVIENNANSFDEDISNSASSTPKGAEKSESRYDLRQNPKKTDKYQAYVKEKAFSAIIIEPSNYKDAIGSEHAAKWKEAIDDELESLHVNNTWEIVDKPDDRNIVGCKWVFKLKEAPGEEVKFKARLVAKGYSQCEGIDYTETFSPVVRYDSVRVMLALAANFDMEIAQFDVKTAFLNGDLTEEIYMQIPEGIPGNENKVCRLRKSLYGLKQASRAWNSKFVDFLEDCNMKQSYADPCVFEGTIQDEKVVLLLYVDDGLILSKKQASINDLMMRLSDKFKITAGKGNYFVGMEITRDRANKIIHVGQSAYIEKTVRRYNMLESKMISTPSDSNVILSKSEEQCDLKFPYRQAIGSLLYAATVSRPDISYAVGEVSRFMENPNQQHVNALKRILRYVNHSKHLGISYGLFESDSEILKGYTDADFARCVDTRRSTTGYVFTIGDAIVTWKSQRQKTVAMSTTEAEYMAASEGAKEAVWLRQLLKDVGFEQKMPTTIYIDNQSAIKLVRNPEYHHRTKHIDIKVHFIRVLCEDETISTKYIRTHDQLADMFTKPLAANSFKRNTIGIGMNECKL